MRVKTVIHNAAPLCALLLLVGALAPLAHADVITTGVLSTGSHIVYIDSLDIIGTGGIFHKYVTPNWHGATGVVDTERLEPPMLVAPQFMQVYITQDAAPALLPIPVLMQDTWYTIPGTPTAAQVMFWWNDTTGIQERGPIGQRRAGLTVSPSVVGAGATIRAERVAGTSCAFTLYDAAGNRVRTLRTQASSSGVASATWTGEDDLGHRLPEGIYYCCLGDPANPTVRKLVLTR